MWVCVIHFAHSNEFGTIRTHWGEWTFWGRHDSSLTVAVWVVMAAEAQGSFLIEHYSFIGDKWMCTYRAIKARATPTDPHHYPLGDAWLEARESSLTPCYGILVCFTVSTWMLHLQGCHFQLSFSLLFSSAVFVDDRLALCEGHQCGRCLPFKHQVVEAGCQGGARLKEAGVPMQRRARERGRYRQREREWEQAHSESCWEQWIIRSALTTKPLSPTPHFLRV